MKLPFTFSSLICLLVGFALVLAMPVQAQQGKPQIVDAPKNKDFSLTPYGLKDVALKIITSTDSTIVCQVINYGAREDRVFTNRTGGTYVKQMAPSQTLTLSYDIPVPGTVSKGALLIDTDTVQVYATNMLTGMNKVKLAIFKIAAPAQ